MTNTMTEEVFNFKTKKLNYEVLLNEVINADKNEVNAMFFMQHNFSRLNKILACAQAHKQGFKFGMMQCMSKWTEQNRTKKSNAHKLWLRLPVTYKKYDKLTKKPIINPETGKQEYGHGFTFKNHWLVYDQTEGAEIDMHEVNTIFNFDNALNNLLIKKIEFDNEGEAGGYAIVQDRVLAVNPAWHDNVAVSKVLFHELAHIVLNHNPEQITEQKELEAELTAMMISKIYDLPCTEQASYIKGWIKENYKMFNNDTYKRCLHACELIIKASMADKPIIEFKNNEYKEIKTND